MGMKFFFHILENLGTKERRCPLNLDVEHLTTSPEGVTGGTNHPGVEMEDLEDRERRGT